MQKINIFVTIFFAAVMLFSPCAFAKKVKYKSPAFFRLIMRENEKYENPKLKEKLSEIKEHTSDSKNTDIKDEFEKYGLEDDERNIFESCFAWLTIVSICIIILKIIFSNFKIPFDYDPNFKNKYVPRRKAKNKKYNFQKRRL